MCFLFCNLLMTKSRRFYLARAGWLSAGSTNMSSTCSLIQSMLWNWQVRVQRETGRWWRTWKRICGRLTGNYTDESRKSRNDWSDAVRKEIKDGVIAWKKSRTCLQFGAVGLLQIVNKTDMFCRFHLTRSSFWSQAVLGGSFCEQFDCSMFCTTINNHFGTFKPAHRIPVKD